MSKPFLLHRPCRLLNRLLRRRMLCLVILAPYLSRALRGISNSNSVPNEPHQKLNGFVSWSQSSNCLQAAPSPDSFVSRGCLLHSHNAPLKSEKLCLSTPMVRVLRPSANTSAT